jgi:hypothetical protein
VTSTLRDATPVERDAARHLLAAAKYLKDDEDEAAFAEIWAERARLTIHSTSGQFGPITGRDAIMDFYRASWARGAHGSGANRETHIFENPYIVALGGGQLEARHNAIFARMAIDGPVLVGFGAFRDIIIEERGRWRIVDRVSHLSRRVLPPVR